MMGRRITTTTVAAVVFAAVTAISGASNSATAAGGWRPLTVEETELVLSKARNFESRERRRRRVRISGLGGTGDWHGGLRLVGTDRDHVLGRLVETDGNRFRVVVPSEQTPVDVVVGRYTPLMWFCFRDVLWTDRRQTIPGTTVVVRHLYGRKMGSDIRGCQDYFAAASPITLYATAFEAFLNGVPAVGCDPSERPNTRAR